MSVLLLDRPRNVLSAETGWPCCGRAACRTIMEGNAPLVAAYGISEETDAHVDLWVEHHGERDGVRIKKDAMWGDHTLAELIRRLCFFEPTGARELHREAMPRRMTGRVRRATRYS